MSRVRLNLKSLTVTEKIAKGRQIVTAMTDNTSFPNPNPPLTDMTTALDELSRQALNDDLIALAREDAMTVLFVTHSVFESAYLSSRVVVMTPRPGRIAADIALSPPPLRDVSWRLTQDFAAGARRVQTALRDAMEAAP